MCLLALSFSCSGGQLLLGLMGLDILNGQNRQSMDCGVQVSSSGLWLGMLLVGHNPGQLIAWCPTAGKAASLRSTSEIAGLSGGLGTKAAPPSAPA